MITRLKGGGSGIKFRGIGLSDTRAVARHDRQTVEVAPGTSVAEPLQDINATSHTGSTYYFGGAVVVNGMSTPEFISLTPTIGSISSAGEIARLTPGKMSILVRSRKITIPFELDLRDKTEDAPFAPPPAPQLPFTFVSTRAGSLAEHCKNEIDSRINITMTMAVHGKIFTTQNHNSSPPLYVRNPNLWCADIDLTCLSPWNSNGFHKKAGTLITPRHAINAAHYEVNVGDTMRFVAADGTVHDRVIVGKRRHPDYASYFPDLTIYTLDSDLPASISPCEVLPADYQSYMVHNYWNRPPAIGLDFDEKATIQECWHSSYENGSRYSVTTTPERTIFYETKIPGDSGNPALFIINGKVALDTLWTLGGSGAGTTIGLFIDDINQMIVDADAQAGVTGPVTDPTWPNANEHYQLKPADFSAFPNYA